MLCEFITLLFLIIKYIDIAKKALITQSLVHEIHNESMMFKSCDISRSYTVALIYINIAYYFFLSPYHQYLIIKIRVL
jgi:hypothetical protein